MSDWTREPTLVEPTGVEEHPPSESPWERRDTLVEAPDAPSRRTLVELAPITDAMIAEAILVCVSEAQDGVQAAVPNAPFGEHAEHSRHLPSKIARPATLHEIPHCSLTSVYTGFAATPDEDR